MVLFLLMCTYVIAVWASADRLHTPARWPVRAQHEGEAFITMKALTDVESDAMEMRYPVQVHGVPKTDSWSGIIRPNETRDEIVIDVPEQRRPEASQLTVRYPPSIATALVAVAATAGGFDADNIPLLQCIDALGLQRRVIFSGV